ncbi:twin-arginine translocase subunit TatC [Thiomicrorhabdus sp. zzn3]|uniref:twin-arginine translocase subunit TatC n=1 Tax=Thiomicrorhabdus sp. zzn3 TaxID=3039775 RepID=UPI00243734C5|nr:twin-arginine translocase subunit TatC [Thiomicrorhabdus sp. zzn3]MDG6778900.1 twin-arginine translocase subunit TatC [Thiomicrorhabdus sp. zzn3]
MSQSAMPPHDQEMTLVQHLLDLKTSLTRGVLAILLFFLILFPFANEIYTYISEPLTRFLPQDTSMIATGVASPFLTPFKLSLVLAIYLAMPVLLYQLWRFIAPALYTHERQLIAPILFFSSFLFYAGGAFAYYVVFPLVFGFLSTTAPEGVTIATDISLYLDFVIKMFFAFGMAFEVPIVTVLLILTGMASPKKLAHARPYVVVGAFVIGMLLTPPDIISQTLLAIPMWLLYELGVLVGATVLKRKGIKDEESEEESSSSQQTSATSNKQSATTDPEQEFDDRYADQVDDDLDWDSEFDRIDSEMAQLEREYNQRQQAEKADNDKPAHAKNSTESKDGKPNSTTPSDKTTDESADVSENASANETDRRNSESK